MTMLKSKMPFLNDPESIHTPDGFPPVIDAHVHIFPGSIFSAVWKWFDEHAWQIRYRMTTTKIFDFLLSHGLSHIIALQYAHKPGIARQLNEYMAEKCREFDNRVTGLATVFPGEKDADHVLEEAFELGLKGVKLHAHVQCFDMNANEMNCIYECCRKNKKPIVMHVGREPKSPAYSCDPHALCHIDKLEAILRSFPDLNICVPHLGFDELSAYRKMIEKYDNLWLDTTMVLADYFPVEKKINLTQYRVDRIMYGSDFPNIPYAWNRELKALREVGLTFDVLEKICHKNAADLFGIALSD